MKLGLAQVAALVAMIATGVRAQNAPPPPPPPPPPLSLLDSNQARTFRTPGLVLRYQFQPGQMQRYRIISDTTSRVSPADGGEPVLTKQHVETVISETVQDIRFPEGIATLILQPESIRIVTNDKPEEISSDQREVYLQDRKLQISPLGKIVDQDTPSTRKAHSSVLDPLLYGFLETQGVFPPDGVRPGEKWTGQSVLRDLNAPVSNVFTIAGIQPTQTGSVVRINSKMIGPVKESGVKDAPSKGEINGKGEIYFDNTNGLLSNSSLSLHARLPLPDQHEKNRSSQTFGNLSPGVVVDRKLTVVRLDSDAAALLSQGQAAPRATLQYTYTQGQAALPSHPQDAPQTQTAVPATDSAPGDAPAQPKPSIPQQDPQATAPQQDQP